MGTPSRDLQNCSGRAQEQTQKLKLDLIVAIFFLPDVSVPGLAGKELNVSLEERSPAQEGSSCGMRLSQKLLWSRDIKCPGQRLGKAEARCSVLGTLLSH